MMMRRMPYCMLQGIPCRRQDLCGAQSSLASRTACVFFIPRYHFSISLGVGMLNNSFPILIFASDHANFTLSPHDIVSRGHDFMFGQSRIEEIPLDCIFMVDDCCWSDGSGAVQVSTQVITGKG